MHGDRIASARKGGEKDAWAVGTAQRETYRVKVWRRRNQERATQILGVKSVVEACAHTVNQKSEY